MAASIAVLPEMRDLILAGRADHHAEPFMRARLSGYRQAIEDAAKFLEQGADELEELDAGTYRGAIEDIRADAAAIRKIGA